jgi:hypothetical protein
LHPSEGHITPAGKKYVLLEKQKKLHIHLEKAENKGTVYKGIYMVSIDSKTLRKQGQKNIQRHPESGEIPEPQYLKNSCFCR